MFGLIKKILPFNQSKEDRIDLESTKDFIDGESEEFVDKRITQHKKLFLYTVLLTSLVSISTSCVRWYNIFLIPI